MGLTTTEDMRREAQDGQGETCLCPKRHLTEGFRMPLAEGYLRAERGSLFPLKVI